MKVKTIKKKESGWVGHFNAEDYLKSLHNKFIAK